MIAAILEIISKLLGIFLPSKSKEEIAFENGSLAGKAEETARNATQENEDIQRAQKASDAVGVAISTGAVSVREHDAFERPE